jgi:hypothetical protein
VGQLSGTSVKGASPALQAAVLQAAVLQAAVPEAAAGRGESLAASLAARGGGCLSVDEALSVK